MTKKVVVHQIVGHRFLGVNEQGDKVMIDGDQPSTGPRPMELLLMALGACTAYDVVDIMRKKKQPLARYRVEVEGERAETHPRRYTRITVTHIASGPGVTPRGPGAGRPPLPHQVLLRLGHPQRRDHHPGRPGALGGGGRRGLMLLAVDIGNTSTALGLFSGEELIAHFRIHTDRMRMESEYRVILKNLFALEDLPPPKAALLASVVPPWSGK